MYLREIEPGARIFIDANIFVYHFSQGSEFNKSCTDFLSGVEASRIHGITSVAVIQEAAHRLMMVEASALLNSKRVERPLRKPLPNNLDQVLCELPDPLL